MHTPTLDPFNPLHPFREKFHLLSQSVAKLAPVWGEKARHDGPAADLLAHNVGMEQPYLIAQVAMWLLRGASIADIERHAADPADYLPFAGAESGMYRALINSMAERTGGLAEAAHGVIALARIFDDFLDAVQETSELSRADILDFFRQRDRSDAPNLHETTA